MNDDIVRESIETSNDLDERQFNIDSLSNVLNKISDRSNPSPVNCNECKEQLIHILEMMSAVDRSVIIGITDRAGKIIYANDLFCKITKYNRDELIGKTHRLLKSGYHDKAFFKHMWDTILAGKIWDGEIKNRAKDDTNYWVKTSIVPVLDPDRNPVMFISIRSEITDGKVAQEQLYLALQEEYRQTVNALDTMIFKVRKNNKKKIYFTLIAGRLTEKLGYSNMQFYNKEVVEVFEKDEAYYLNGQFLLAFQGEQVSFKFKIKGMTLFISLSPIVQNGKVIEIVGNCSDISELEKAHETINNMAYHDVVTNLPNQRLFDKDLNQILQTARIHQMSFGVLCLKINGFTNANELLGHEVGEKLVRSITSDLNKIIHSFGVLYRSEGSRFLIIIKSINKPDELQGFAEIIQKEVAKLQHIDNHEIRLTSNIGASSYPDCGNDPQALIKSAYISLQYSRNTAFCHYKYYSKEVHDYYQENQLLEHALKQAIQKNELTLHYQPKIDIKHNRITGMEALVRWNSPQLGSISPAKFIPLAEETGLIFTIGEWVLTEACRQNVEWISQGFTPLKIAVNVSPHELQHSLFISKLEHILKTTGLNPEYLEIEITENSLMDDKEESIAIIKRLRSIGVSVAIDDFGTGYSSLMYLKNFPVTTLKIDQCFIKDALQSSSDTQLVIGMINIAHIFNLEVVAEGVETLEVADFLKSYDCEQVQGYYYSKPLPAEQFERKFLRVEQHI